jgi:TPR repeat protein
MNEATGRFERLELSRPSDGTETPPKKIEVSNTVAEADEPSEVGGPETFIEKHIHRELDPYILAARRAASAAAVLSDIQEQPADEEEESSAWRHFIEARVKIGRKQRLTLGVATFAIFVTGGYLAFSVGEANGHAAASLPAHSKVAAAQHHASEPGPRKLASATPLDRLSALANAGNASAELIVGLKYLHGEGVKQDSARAVQWIQKAAVAHEPLAQYWLGSLYQRGEGTPPDSVEALRWYEAAAGQGNCRAMHALGVAYAEGQGTSKDLAQAAHWFARAAALGYVNAQFNLAVLYERGDGVPQSLREAFKWYSIAAANGDSESRTRVDALKLQLPAADLEGAQLAAAEFHPESIDRGANNAPVIADIAASTISSR